MYEEGGVELFDWFSVGCVCICVCVHTRVCVCVCGGILSVWVASSPYVRMVSTDSSFSKNINSIRLLVNSGRALYPDCKQYLAELV